MFIRTKEQMVSTSHLYSDSVAGLKTYYERTIMKRGEKHYWITSIEGHSVSLVVTPSDDEHVIEFEVDGSYDKSSDKPNIRITRWLLSVWRKVLSLEGVVSIGCYAHKDDGNQAYRVKLYEKMGFSVDEECSDENHVLMSYTK